MKERIAWIDGVKGFAILLVVFGHIIDGYMRAGIYPEAIFVMSTLHDIIYVFHVPVFFIVSGYVSKRYFDGRLGNNKKIKRQLVKLTVIYFVFSWLALAAKMCFSEAVNVKISWDDFGKVIYAPVDQFWYIYCYIVFLCAFWILRKKINDKKFIFIEILIIFTIHFCAVIFGEYIGVLGRIGYNFLFFWVGVRLLPDIIPKKMTMVNLGLSFTSIILCVGGGINLYSVPFVQSCLALSFSGSLIGCMQILLVRKNSFCLGILGKASLHIFIWHTFVATVVRKGILLVGKENIGPVMGVFSNLIISISVCLIIYYFLNSSKGLAKERSNLTKAERRG